MFKQKKLEYTGLVAVTLDAVLVVVFEIVLYSFLEIDMFGILND